MHPRTSCLSQVNMQVVLSAEMLLAMMEYLEVYCKIEVSSTILWLTTRLVNARVTRVAAIVHAK